MLDKENLPRTQAAKVERFLQFIAEREAIRRRREAGAPWPWTQDAILRSWSFCNVHREHDRVTRWIADNWRTSHAADRDVFFAMVVARFINWPPTLAEMGYLVPSSRDHFIDVLTARKARGEQIVGPAYVTPAPAQRGADKARYIADDLLTPIWNDREFLQLRSGDTLLTFALRLSKCRGLGAGFMAGQVIAFAAASSHSRSRARARRAIPAIPSKTSERVQQ